jgi:uncharacterized protein (DUF4415 family)
MKKQAKKTRSNAITPKSSRGRKLASIRASTEEIAPPDARRWMAEAEKLYRPIKKPVTLRLDADVLMWFQAQGRGYQTRINRTLRTVMIKQRKAENR